MGPIVRPSDAEDQPPSTDQMATAEDTSPLRDPELAAFSAWLDDLPEFTVATKCDSDGRWFALVEEFDITGMGGSEGAAVRDMVHLLAAYLWAHFRDGTPFAQTLRPIPTKLKFEIRRDSLVGRGLNAVHRRQRGRERTMLFPADYLQASNC